MTDRRLLKQIIIIVILFCGCLAAQTRNPERKVEGNAITSENDPKVRIELLKSVHYVGADRWVLYGIADCELHVFVAADQRKNVPSLYWCSSKTWRRPDSEKERVRFIAAFMSFLSYSQNAFLKWREGLLASPLWMGWQHVIMNLVGAPGGKAFWKDRAYMFGDEFRRYIENDLMKREPHPDAKPMGAFSISPHTE